MKVETIYRILTYILVPIAALLGFFDLIALFAALANPAVLIGVFMMACIVIYTFCALSFLNRGIIAHRPCKPSLRDWIRVNAFVSLLFASLSLIQSVTLVSNSAVLGQTIDAAMPTQTSLPAGVTREMLESFMRGSLYFMLMLSIILIIHIIITFRLLRKYSYLFDNSSPSE
jgi:hypothetical protein